MEADNQRIPNTNNAARDYIDRGWSVVPVPRGQKGPNVREWQKLRISTGEVGEFFVGESNIGIQLGEASGGLADVDLDCPEAVAIGRDLLPSTLMSGRGEQVTHYWYTSPGSSAYKFKDVDGKVIAEIRADGGYQTLVAPSVHPSGERYEWKNQREPLEIAAHELRGKVARVAVSSLIARHLPDGGRHDIALAYVGFMLRNLIERGMDDQEAFAYVCAILDAAWGFRNAPSEAFTDIEGAVQSTLKKINAGEPYTQKRELEQLIGKEIVSRIEDWLGWGPLTPAEQEEVEQRQRVKRAEKVWEDERVRGLATSPELLKALYERVAESGLLGEEENAKLLLLAAVSLVRGKPISAIIKGTSAVGKSEIIKAVTRALPPEMVVERQSMSSQSLVYMGENGQLQNKLLVVYELGGFGQEGSEGLEQAKQLLSEGRISRQTVDRDEQNRNTGRAIVTEGRTAMWTTTTRVKTDYELSTRVLELTPDDGQDQTGLINERAFDYEADERETDFADCHALFTWLMGQDNRVYFPYGKAIGQMLPKSAVEMRRVAPRVRLLVDAHATLHQANRERDERGRIVATLEDYAAVRDLVEPFVGAASEQGVKPQVRETVEAATRLLDSEDFDHEGVTSKDLQTELGLDNSAAYRRIQAAYPYLVQLDEKRGRAKQYGKGDELPASSNVLPIPDELCKFARESTPEAPETIKRQTGDEKRAKFDAKFAQRSSLSHGSETHDHDRNGESAGGHGCEEHESARGSIGLQTCKVREVEPAESGSLRKVRTNFAEFAGQLEDFLLSRKRLPYTDRGYSVAARSFSKLHGVEVSPSEVKAVAQSLQVAT